MRKRSAACCLGRQADPLSKRHHVHQRVTRHWTAAHVWTVFERRQASNDKIMDHQPPFRPAEDETLIPQIFPGNGILGAKRMRVRQHDEHAFAPEPDNIAIARNRLVP